MNDQRVGGWRLVPQGVRAQETLCALDDAWPHRYSWQIGQCPRHRMGTKLADIRFPMRMGGLMPDLTRGLGTVAP
jgi:hypothetical protein